MNALPNTATCWSCDTTKPRAYTDVLGLHWCEDCYQTYYLGSL